MTQPSTDTLSRSTTIELINALPSEEGFGISGMKIWLARYIRPHHLGGDLGREFAKSSRVRHFTLSHENSNLEDILKSGHAVWVAPDGAGIVYATFNDSEVEEVQFEVYSQEGSDPYPRVSSMRYPKVGG